MKNDIKPTSTLYMDIETGIDPVMSGVVNTVRSGVSVDVTQTFTVPKGNIKVGDTLIHKVSSSVFTVIAVTYDGFVLKDTKDETEITADARTTKQSCWLMVETAKEGG